MHKPLVLRGPSGLGDSIYLRPIAERLAQSRPVVVLSNYPDVFRGAGVQVKPFSRVEPKPEMVAHYVHGKNNPHTNQFQDMCASAKISSELRFDWQVVNQKLIDSLRRQADGKQLIIVHGGRTPMARTDNFGIELLPQREAFETVLNELREQCFLVRVGDHAVYPLPVDLDLPARATSISDLVDIGASCDGWVAQCSFAVPLAEAFGKKLLAVWADRGLRAKSSYVRAITPQKIFSKKESKFIMDNWAVERMKEAARAFRDS